MPQKDVFQSDNLHRCRWTVQSTAACATNMESARIPPPSSSTTAGLDDGGDQGQQDEHGQR